MEDLGRYPMSVILSYLTETEGCSLLLCRRQWTRQLLPIFRLPNKHDATFGSLRVIGSSIQNKNTNKKKQNRHRFLVVPVQDATVRLDRLNTRRWRQRQHNNNNNNNNNNSMPTHQTTNQVAAEEWNQLLRLQHGDKDNGKNSKSHKKDDRAYFSYPPLLQILPSNKKSSSSLSSSNASFFLPGITTLVSYPRSGNTLLRTYLESWTGLVTGSDTRPDRSLSIALAEQFDLVGEGLTNQSSLLLPFVKTHWPERMGCRQFKTHRVVLLVRNPFDATDSCWNLNVTNTHTDKVTEEVYQQYHDFYCDYIRNEMKVWCQFHHFWLDDKKNKNNNKHNNTIPILLVRYEDLIEDPRRELLRILEFSTTLSMSTIDTTVTPTLLEATMKERLDVLLQQKHGYQSTTTTTTSTTTNSSSSSSSSGDGGKKKSNLRHGRSLKRHSKEFIKELHDIDKKNSTAAGDGLLKRFGYHVYDQDFPNPQPLPPPPTPPPIIIATKETKTTNTTTTTANPTTTIATTLTINRPDCSIRPPNCPFGRNMRSWRRQRTADDTKPFPTISR